MFANLYNTPMLHLLALFSVLGEFIIYALIIVLSPLKGKQVSISEHAASRRWLYLLLGISSTVFGGIFSYYLYHLFGPEFGLSRIYYGAVFINWFCMLLAVWIPYRSTKKGLQNPHYRAALGMACMLPLIIATLAFAHHVNAIVHVIAAIATAWYCFTIYLGLFLYRLPLAKRLHPYLLVIELFNLASIFGILLGVGFWK
jgi:hypothetical protein